MTIEDRMKKLGFVKGEADFALIFTDKTRWLVFTEDGRLPAQSTDKVRAVYTDEGGRAYAEINTTFSTILNGRTTLGHPIGRSVAPQTTVQEENHAA